MREGKRQEETIGGGDVGKETGKKERDVRGKAGEGTGKVMRDRRTDGGWEMGKGTG